jgi:hypothetical protein
MQTDYQGANSIANLIEITGLTKFRITRVGINKNSVPVYEHIGTGSNDKAVSKFREWASLTDNCLPYEMELFNSKEDSEQNGEEVHNKKQGKILRFTFCLNKEERTSNINGVQNNNNSGNVTELIENALLKQRAMYENNELMKKLETMETKLNEYIAEEEEEEEEEQSELGGINSPAMMNLLGLLNKMVSGINNKPKTVINGLQNDQITNINKAIKILSKYDSEIDSDLLKLANLAENNTATFEMLLKTLRNM